MGNSTLISARKAKVDEFYTQLSDIEAELRHYKEHFAAYERQKGLCARCNKEFKIEQMEADHITPWCKGGPTTSDNCQMLCKECNRRKSGK